MKTIQTGSITATALVWALWGCSGAAPVPVENATPVEAEPASQEVREVPVIEGIHGTISRSDVESVFADRMVELHGCYSDAVEIFEDIEGTIEFFFTVDPAGAVSKAHVSRSDLGSLEAEKCMLGKLLRFRFPRPEGGSADVQYDLLLEAPYEHPAPLSWTNDDVRDLLENKKAVIEECLAGDEGVVLTVWVGPGGRVYATGASSETIEAYSSATCLAQQARTWAFPNPGREIAKASLEF